MPLPPRVPRSARPRPAPSPPPTKFGPVAAQPKAGPPVPASYGIPPPPTRFGAAATMQASRAAPTAGGGAKPFAPTVTPPHGMPPPPTRFGAVGTVQPMRSAQSTGNGASSVGSTRGAPRGMPPPPTRFGPATAVQAMDAKNVPEGKKSDMPQAVDWFNFDAFNATKTNSNVQSGFDDFANFGAFNEIGTSGNVKSDFSDSQKSAANVVEVGIDDMKSANYGDILLTKGVGNCVVIVLQAENGAAVMAHVNTNSKRSASDYEIVKHNMLESLGEFAANVSNSNTKCYICFGGVWKFGKYGGFESKFTRDYLKPVLEAITEVFGVERTDTSPCAINVEFITTTSEFRDLGKM